MDRENADQDNGSKRFRYLFYIALSIVGLTIYIFLAVPVIWHYLGTIFTGLALVLLYLLVLYLVERQAMRTNLDSDQNFVKVILSFSALRYIVIAVALAVSVIYTIPVVTTQHTNDYKLYLEMKNGKINYAYRLKYFGDTKEEIDKSRQLTPEKQKRDTTLQLVLAVPIFSLIYICVALVLMVLSMGVLLLVPPVSSSTKPVPEEFIDRLVKMSAKQAEIINPGILGAIEADVDEPRSVAISVLSNGIWQDMYRSLWIALGLLLFGFILLVVGLGSGYLI